MVDVGRIPTGAARWLLPALVMAAWLLFLTSRQVALFPSTGPSPEPPPVAPIVFGATLLAVEVRRWRPTTVTHVVMLAVITGGIALLAAQLGTPLANATTDYCGDFCRSAIIGRAVTFFGWPIVTAGALWVLARVEARNKTTAGLERAAWTRAWAGTSLVLGLAASVAWWMIILPDG